MPNYVTTRIKFSSKGKFDEFISKHVIENEEGEHSFDFNTIVRRPESLNIESGSKTMDGINLALRELRIGSLPNAHETIRKVREVLAPVYPWDIPLATDSAADELAKEARERGNYDELIELGKIAVSNIVAYGYADWYGWDLANWGTKWNSFDFGANPLDLTVEFDTAWSCPHPIIDKLVEEMGASAFVSIEWADEDIGANCGYYRLYGDTGCYPYELPLCSDEAMELAMDVKGMEGVYAKGEDGKWHYVE